MICPEFPPNAIGGGGEVFRALSRHLPAFNIQLDVIAANYRGGANDWSEAGVRYYEIPLLPTPAGAPFLRTALPPTFAGRRKLRRLIASGGYDIAHLHGVSFAVVDLSAHLLRTRNIPWVFTLHGAPRTPYRMGGIFRAGYETYLRRYGSLAMRSASIRTTVSRAATEFPSIARYMSDAKVIPHGIDVDSFAAVMPEDAIAGWPHQTARIVLSIGRIDYAKGYDIGVRALAAMRARDVAYVILGEDLGELRRMRELAEHLGVAERVFTPGYATIEQRRFALRRCTLVWAPSRYESFGLAVLEAMAAGVPVIASGAEGLRETFTGTLEQMLMAAAPDDVASLASKSDTLLIDERERRRIGEQLRARAADFDWNRIAGEYVACYVKVQESASCGTL